MDDNIIYQICAGIIALSFLTLVVYVILTLHALRKLLNHVNKVAATVQCGIEGLKKGSERLLDKTHEVTQEVCDHVHNCRSSLKNFSFLNGLLQSISGCFKKKKHDLKKERESEEEEDEFEDEDFEEKKINLSEEEDQIRMRKHYLLMAEELMEYLAFGVVVCKRLKKIKDELRK